MTEVDIRKTKTVDIAEPYEIRQKLLETGWVQANLYTADYWWFTINYKKVGCERKSLDGNTPLMLLINNIPKVCTIKEGYDLFHSGYELKVLGLHPIFHKIDWYPIYNATKHEVDESISIGFTGQDKIISSKGHNFYRWSFSNIELVESENLKLTDSLVTIKPFFPRYELPDFVKLAKNRNNLNRKHGHKGITFTDSLFRSHSSKNWYRMPIASKEFFFLLGILIADGTLADKKLFIAQKSPDRNKIIEETIKNTIGHSVKNNYGSYPISSSAISDYIVHCGFIHGAANKEVPWIVWGTNDEFKKEFIKGYFFGDGWILKRTDNDPLPSVRVTTKSEKLAVGITWLLLSLGVPCRKTSNSKKFHTVSIDRSDKWLEIIGQIPTKEFSVSRKTRNYGWQLDQMIGQNNHHFKSSSHSSGLFQLIQLGYLNNRTINSKEYIQGKKTLYDFSVSESENFVVGNNAILAHNTILDLTASLGDRLSGQLFKMLEHYDFSILLIEGHWKVVQDRLMSIRGIEQWHWTTVWNYLQTWQDKGITLQLTSNEGHTIRRLNELYAYYGKEAHAGGLKKSHVEDNRILALQCGGIGPKLGKLLLDKFGSIKNIANASVDDFMAIEKIGRAKAESLYNHFNINKSTGEIG